MCGRFTLSFFPDAETQFEELFGIPFPDVYYPPLLGEFLPFRDITVLHREEAERLACRPMFWGLIPYNARTFQPERTWFNMRREKLQQPYCKHLLRRKRCVVPVTSFFENKKEGGKPVYATVEIDGRKLRKKVSFEFRGKEEPLLALGGVFDVWQQDGEVKYSCSIITLPPNELIREIHDRMPLILPKERIPIWLDRRVDQFERVIQLVQPYPSDRLQRTQVWPRPRPARTEQGELFKT